MASKTTNPFVFLQQVADGNLEGDLAHPARDPHFLASWFLFLRVWLRFSFSCPTRSSRGSWSSSSASGVRPVGKGEHLK